MAIIGIDMDGTIADFTTLSFENVEKVFGIKMTKEDAWKPNTGELVWERMTDKQKSMYENQRDIYKDICPKGFFSEILPFEGAVKAVNYMAELGHKIIFVTKPLNWEHSAPEKAEWLKRYFPELDYKIIMVDDMHSKHIVDVNILIEDDPRALEGTMAVPICINQPWNQDIDMKGIHVVEDITVAAEKVFEIGAEIDEWLRED